MKKNSFLKASAILFLGDFLTKILGFIYLAPLERIDGGIGTVQGYLMLPYSFFITFSVMGITNVMMYKLGPVIDDPDNYKRNFLDGVYYVLITSTIITLGLILFSSAMMNQSAAGVSYLPDLIVSMKIIAISILFFAANTLIRAVMLSKSHMTVISITYITEQLVKIIILVAGCYYYISVKGMDVGVSSYVTAWSVTISVASTTVILAVYAAKVKLFDFMSAAKYSWKPSSFKVIFMLGAVYFVNSIFINGFNQIDLMIFNDSLSNKGYGIVDIENFTAIYFTWSWKLIMMVITLGSAFITVMINQMTQQETIEDKVAVMKSVLDFVLLYTLLATVFFLIAGGDFYNWFYTPSEEGVLVMMAQAMLIVPFMLRMLLSVFSITVGQRRIVLLSTAVIFAVKIILNPICFYFFEIYGYVLASFIAAVVSMIFMLVLDHNIFKFTAKEYFHKFKIFFNMFIVFLICLVAKTFVHNSLDLSYFWNLVILSVVILATFAVLNLKYIRQFKQLA